MCGGNKGQSQSQTSQTQTYTPNPQAQGYLTSALQQGQTAAQAPFQAPNAPVAGFSQDQQNAFNTVNNSQGMAQPYFNQAQTDFTPGGAQAFFNPMASAVTSQLNNIFGQQNSQNTGQLTQAAGGVGADRIAVGQSELANQQGLAAGQTLANLYGQSAQQAQSAGYGQAALGSAAQNSALTGAQAQLGTGGLQQQLSQAQLNSPYQNILARLAYPFQTAQFNAGITGALAPGLGGTTSGVGNTTSTPAQPSIWSQLLGAGVAGAGIYGGLNGGFGGSGSGKGSGGGFVGDSSVGGAPLSGYSGGPPGTANSAFYGPVAPYASGGDVSDEPINIDTQSIVPNEQLQAIQPHIPQLNLNPPQQSQASGSGGSSIGDIAKIASMAMMFAKEGGRVDPKKFDGYNPFFASGGDTTFADRWAGLDDPPASAAIPAWASMTGDPGGQTFADRFSAAPGETPTWASLNGSPAETPSEPYRLDPAATQVWRDGTPTPSDVATANGSDAAGEDTPALALSGKPATSLPPEITTGSSDGADTSAASPVPGASRSSSFIDSPWAALAAAGLGMMGGTSPFAGVNIGQGGLQGIKTLEQQKAAGQKDTTIAQAAKRLQQEADFHADAVKAQNRPYEQMTKAEEAANARALEVARMNRIPPGFRVSQDGKSLEPITGGPHDTKTIADEAAAKRLPGMSDEALTPLVDSYMAGNTGVLTGVGRGTQGAQNLERFWTLTAEKLKNEGKSGKDLAAARANFMAQSAGARVAATREANIETAVNEAKGTFPQVLAASEKLPRTSYPLANAAIQAYRTATGSPEQRQYGAAIQAAITAYSQAMSRTGANSVYAQQHAEQLMSKIDGPVALKATMDQLDTEMQIAKSAPEQTRQSILNRILGIEPKGGAAVAPAAAPAASAQDQQALEWARANPQDPRAAKILQRLGVQ